MKPLSTISALLLFGLVHLQAQSFSISIDGSYARHTVDFAGFTPEVGFSPSIGFDARFNVSENSSIQSGVSFAPLLLNGSRDIFDLNMVPIGEVSVATRINSFAIPVSYVYKFNKLSFGLGYQLNLIHSSRVTVTGQADLNMDGMLEPFETEENGGSNDLFYHGFVATVLYELTPRAELSAQVFNAPTGFSGEDRISNSLSIYSLGLNYRFID